MPAVAPLGLALFALQIVLGIYAYRSLVVDDRGSAVAVGVAATVLGLFVLIRFGVLAVLAYDLAVGVGVHYFQPTGRRGQPAT